MTHKTKNRMKTFKPFAYMLAVTAVAVQLVACLGNDDPYRAGFSFTKPTAVRTEVYANTSTDSLVMTCLGAWHITADTPDAAWCTIDEMKGAGNAIYYLGVHFSENTTGRARLAQFTITDNEHPNEAHGSWQYLQHATRGDGSWGSAALVKSITSSDNWQVDIEYDTKSRPVKLSVKGPDNYNEQFSMVYNEREESLTVSTSGNTLTGKMDKGYQTERLLGVGDTIGYQSQYYSYGMEMPASQAFNYVSARQKRTQAYAYLLNGKSLAPDSLHTADSLIYYCRWKVVDKPLVVERYKLEYSQTDNRYQTVDANQLLLGMDGCEPLQLVSMFRYCRSTSIVKRATATGGTIDVATELNADRSVRRMVVNDSRRGTETTYDFTY